MHYFIAPAVFITDYFIKEHVEKECREGEQKNVLKGRAVMQKHHNRGAVMNFMDKRQPLVAGVSAILTVMVFACYVASIVKKEAAACKAGIALMLGGALSNTYDRLRRSYVVDYISFRVRWKALAGVIFNLSDFCIFIGTALALFFSGRTK